MKGKESSDTERMHFIDRIFNGVETTTKPLNTRIVLLKGLCFLRKERNMCSALLISVELLGMLRGKFEQQLKDFRDLVKHFLIDTFCNRNFTMELKNFNNPLLFLDRKLPATAGTADLTTAPIASRSNNHPRRRFIESQAFNACREIRTRTIL